MIARRRYIFVPLGSAGDVNPLLWLAKLAESRGHETVVITQAAVADLSRLAGFRTIPVGRVEDVESVIRDPDIWHPDRAFALLARQLPAWARHMIPAICSEIVPGRTTLVGGAIAFGARIAAEMLRVPLVTVQLQPAVFMGADDAPVMRAGLEWIKRLPRWARRLFFSMIHWHADRFLRDPINALRGEFGLERPIRGVMRDWWMSPDRVLAMFPEWFAPRHGDWPAQTVLTRFPLYDLGDAKPAPPGLDAFLAAGEPPILVTPGSANAHAREFLAESAGACRRIGRRALLVTRYPEQLPSPLPTGSAHFDYIPFGQVFGRCAAVVHHGGIGTCSQALAAGVPQLVMPMSHDQPDSAWRLRALGVAEYLHPPKFRARAVAAALARLSGSASVAAACREIKDRMAAQMPPERVTSLLEIV